MYHMWHLFKLNIPEMFFKFERFEGLEAMCTVLALSEVYMRTSLKNNNNQNKIYSAYVG
jgi:hypothetical protein